MNEVRSCEHDSMPGVGYVVCRSNAVMCHLYASPPSDRIYRRTAMLSTSPFGGRMQSHIIATSPAPGRSPSLRLALFRARPHCCNPANVGTRRCCSCACTSTLRACPSRQPSTLHDAVFGRQDSPRSATRVTGLCKATSPRSPCVLCNRSSSPPLSSPPSSSPPSTSDFVLCTRPQDHRYSTQSCQPVC